jgi:TetR/AcrR family transcriptional regulator, mexJK operon transcriptional repressor
LTKINLRRSILGRPKDIEKYSAILDAARSMFFAQGFKEVSIENVAKTASVARMTVYSHFVDKEALFAAVVAREGETLSRALDDLSPAEIHPAKETASKLSNDLTEFGIALLTFRSKPETQAFNRLIEAEARNHPKLAEAFSKSGPRAVVGKLAARLEMASRKKIIVIKDPTQAATLLIGMLRSIEYYSAVTKQTSSPTKAVIVDYVKECVERFLRAFR